MVAQGPPAGGAWGPRGEALRPKDAGQTPLLLHIQTPASRPSQLLTPTPDPIQNDPEPSRTPDPKSIIGL